MSLKNLSIVAILVLAILKSKNAFAGHMVGNGGDVVYCSGVPSAEMYDIYEALPRYGLRPDFGEASTYMEMVRYSLGQFAGVAPQRAERYLADAESFLSEANFVNAPLVNIDDAEMIIDSSTGCEIRQVAIQREPEVVLDKRYTVDAQMWNLLSEAGKAALLLHEIIYREAIEFGHANSVKVRYFAANIFSGRAAAMTQKEYYDLLREVDFDRYEYGGHVFMMYKSAVSDDPGRCLAAVNTIINPTPMVVAFYPDGTLKSGFLRCKEPFSLFGQVIQGDAASANLTPTIDRRVDFFANGQVQRVFASRGVEVSIHGQPYRAARKIILHENGDIAQAFLLTPARTLTRSNRRLLCRKWLDPTDGDWMEHWFDQDGFVTAWDRTSCSILP